VKYALTELTPAEERVADLLLEALPDKEIAWRLGNSVSTIKNHLKAIRRKLGAKSRTHAVVILYRRRARQVNEGWGG
jgi:DNA-binding CsgD family transcriptional regulator